MKKSFLLIALSIFCLLQTGCQEDDVVITTEKEHVGEPYSSTEFSRVYVLNAGGMGMNKASLDYYNLETGDYYRNIYPKANPTVVKELGDVGNDLQVYGNKLYAVINNSNKIEVMDVKTAKRIKQIDVENCRYITFYNGKAYVTSFAGGINLGENNQLGSVAEIDTTSLQITRTVVVGYQPEGVLAHEGKLYVANSGGYRSPNYDTTVSVIDLNTFTETKKIEVAPNLHQILADKRGDIYVTSRGNYYDLAPKLVVLDSKIDEVKKVINIPVGGMCLNGDSIYYYSNDWNFTTNETITTYGIINTRTKEKVSDSFIKDGTEKQIKTPYGIAVNPQTKDIYITDVQDYTVTGYVFCFNSKGIKKWRTQGGNVPTCFTFVKR